MFFFLRVWTNGSCVALLRIQHSLAFMFLKQFHIHSDIRVQRSAFALFQLHVNGEYQNQSNANELRRLAQFEIEPNTEPVCDHSHLYAYVFSSHRIYFNGHHRTITYGFVTSTSHLFFLVLMFYLNASFQILKNKTERAARREKIQIIYLWSNV